MWLDAILFGVQSIVELSSNVFTLLLGGPILDILFDPFDIGISAVLAFFGGK
jgi:hypothetical protein